MIYQAYQAQVDLLAPLHAVAQSATSMLNLVATPYGAPFRRISAALEVFTRTRLTHSRPPFGIASVRVGENDIGVQEQVVQCTPFATLLRFARADVLDGSAPDLPKVLIAAPLSGHFATLLRDTVRTMLGDHDVYVTDWHNARHVPVADGPFGLAEYTEHIIRFVEAIGPGCHILAICQPCVSVLAAVSLMAKRDHEAQPKSMTLMAGPIDCRINPTKVNEMAVSKPIEWFESQLISTVPARFAGARRRVYPGFTQLSAFMSMNLDRHRQAFADLYKHLVEGDVEKATAINEFYAEYFAVNDLAAEFYLETVQSVFQDYDLARGEMYVRGERIDCSSIRRTALFTVEGERDDICSIGQTVAAHDMCSKLAPYLKTHHVQLGVGHYGVFAGKRWQTQIYPRVRELIHTSR